MERAMQEVPTQLQPHCGTLAPYSICARLYKDNKHVDSASKSRPAAIIEASVVTLPRC